MKNVCRICHGCVYLLFRIALWFKMPQFNSYFGDSSLGCLSVPGRLNFPVFFELLSELLGGLIDRLIKSALSLPIECLVGGALTFRGVTRVTGVTGAESASPILIRGECRNFGEFPPDLTSVLSALCEYDADFIDMVRGLVSGDIGREAFESLEAPLRLADLLGPANGNTADDLDDPVAGP